jgi:hypothetical protein
MNKILWDATPNRGLQDFTENPLFRLNAPHKALGYVRRTPPSEPFGVDAKRVPRSAHIVARIRVTERNCVWNSDPMNEHPDEHYDATWGIMIFQRWEGHGDPGNGRWFARERIKLRPGTLVSRVPLQPDAWSNVWGKVPPDNAGGVKAWEATLLRPLQLGMCFGGKFYGHGVAAEKGSATIRVLSVNLVF